MSLIWLGKSTPVAYSVNKPTNTPNITHRPLPISLASVQPNTLRTATATRDSNWGEWTLHVHSCDGWDISWACRAVHV